MDYGKLYIVGTPIGNLNDITLRALKVLQQVDIIAAEDTRTSLKLLNHFNIKKSLFSYHKHNEQTKSEEIIEKLRQGTNIALVTDAGMPGISDPGSIVIKKCIEEGIGFEVIPGVTACATALVYSGLDTNGFVFKGFLPRDNKSRAEVVAEIKDLQNTIIFYESPHRILSFLECIKEYLGNRQIAVCREMTKLHEEIIRGNVEEAIKYFNVNLPRGEFVIAIEGKSKEEIQEEKNAIWDKLSIKEHIEYYISSGIEKKDAIKKVAKDRNMTKSDIYRHSIDI